MTLKIPKNVDVDFVCNCAQAAPLTDEQRLRVADLRRALKAALTAYRKTLKPKRRT